MAVMLFFLLLFLLLSLESPIMHPSDSDCLFIQSPSLKSLFRSAVVEGPLLAGVLLRPHAPVAEVDADVGDLAVDGDAVVVEAGRLQDDARGADEHGQREDPQEEPVQHHGHVLPVLFHLQNKEDGSDVEGKILDGQKHSLS